MVIETFPPGNVDLVGERFHAQGRMMPPDVLYVSSWMTADGSQCYQLMEAPTRESLDPWIAAWSDLVSFEVRAVLTSADYWGSRDS